MLPHRSFGKTGPRSEGEKLYLKLRDGVVMTASDYAGKLVGLVESSAIELVRSMGYIGPTSESVRTSPGAELVFRKMKEPDSD